MQEITQGNQDLVDYIQRVLGYCLTGETIDHALFYMWGGGQNGKTTILETAGFIMGDYWIESPPQAFIASTEGRHETEIARMHNVRLVTSDELPHGKEWDTSKVKRLTGGSTISARYMRQDYFEFEPQFKLLMAGNDKPSLHQVDDAIKRRFNLIPLTYKIPDARKDRSLGEKLRAEAPSILGWMIDGAIQWRQMGLHTPACVIDETASYLSREDNMTSWFEECCERDPDAFCTTTELFQSWIAWARSNEERVGSRKAFSQQLDSRSRIYGLSKRKTNAANGFVGAAILNGDAAARAEPSK
jgi:putative DNA primase/helicase